MKKLLIFCILSCWHLHALEVRSTLKIYHDLFTSLLHTSHYHIYTDDKSLYAVFSKSNKISLVQDPSNADALVISKRSSLKHIPHTGNTIILATKYSLLQHSRHIIGAFYWRKGRAQLLFVKKRLQGLGISLPGKYRKYTVDTL